MSPFSGLNGDQGIEEEEKKMKFLSPQKLPHNTCQKHSYKLNRQ